MKKLLALLLLSPLVAGASVAEYCMEKYPPEKSKDKFVQCVDDVLEYSKNNRNTTNENIEPVTEENYPSDQFNFLDPSALAMNNFSQSQKNEALKIYADFLKGEKNKAFVFSYNVNKFRIGDVYSWCTDKNNILDASNCAIAKCERSKSKGEVCLVQYENDNYVFAKNRNILKNKYASSNQANQNRNQTDWAGAASALGSMIQNNPAFGGTPPTKICNFKNFNGQIISGDCSKFSITIGNDTYRKVK